MADDSKNYPQLETLDPYDGRWKLTPVHMFEPLADGLTSAPFWLPPGHSAKHYDQWSRYFTAHGYPYSDVNICVQTRNGYDGRMPTRDEFPMRQVWYVKAARDVMASIAYTIAHDSGPIAVVHFTRTGVEQPVLIAGFDEPLKPRDMVRAVYEQMFEWYTALKKSGIRIDPDIMNGIRNALYVRALSRISGNLRFSWSVDVVTCGDYPSELHPGDSIVHVPHEVLDSCCRKHDVGGEIIDNVIFHIAMKLESNVEEDDFETVSRVSDSLMAAFGRPNVQKLMTNGELSYVDIDYDQSLHMSQEELSIEFFSLLDTVGDVYRNPDDERPLEYSKVRPELRRGQLHVCTYSMGHHLRLGSRPPVPVNDPSPMIKSAIKR